jgi:phage tail sheath protein FI
MPSSLTFPGVYIEEIPSGVRTIVGVSTSITAFVGRAQKGEANTPVRITNFGDFDRIFGGLWPPSMMSFAVQQYFLNGGMEAIVVRVEREGDPEDEQTAISATFTLAGADAPLVLRASGPGAWANDLDVVVNYDTRDPESPTEFNLIVQDASVDPPVPLETLRNLSTDPQSENFLHRVVEQRSDLIDLDPDTSIPAERPNEGTAAKTPGRDGGQIGDNDVAPPDGEGTKRGIYALEEADIFNLLVLPPFSPTDDPSQDTWNKAADYCQKRRAMLLVDPPESAKDHADIIDALESGVSISSAFKKNAALYFPRLRVPNPLRKNLLEEYVPSAAVAGVFARTDSQRGVWKAPAGLEAGIVARELTVTLTDAENGQLNPLGINCLRTFPLVGRVVWGARTLDGADVLASEWKYVPIRRLALYIEESLFRNTKWVVFEPNDEPLWAQIRLNVGSFMHQLFRQGAFQGKSPRDAYFVKCDAETTTQADRNLGIVNILVGFAPLKPAEFVVIKIQQIAGEIET